MKKPAPDEVRAYWSEASLYGDPADFYDHFQANGWMVGRVPMKDWQAAARNWSRNELKWNGQSAKVSQRQPPSATSDDVRKEEVLRELEMERRLRESR